MNIIGIDYSMTSPGVCIFDGNQYIYHAFASTKKHNGEVLKNDNHCFYLHPAIKPEQFNYRYDRFRAVAKFVMTIIEKYENPVLYIEGYSMGSTGARILDIAEHGATLRLALFDQNIRPIEVPPTTLKKFATGKGNAKKEQMNNSFIDKNGFSIGQVLFNDKEQIKSPVNDLVDAYWLVQYGLAQLDKQC